MIPQPSDSRDTEHPTVPEDAGTVQAVRPKSAANVTDLDCFEAEAPNDPGDLWHIQEPVPSRAFLWPSDRKADILSLFGRRYQRC